MAYTVQAQRGSLAFGVCLVVLEAHQISQNSGIRALGGPSVSR